MKFIVVKNEFDFKNIKNVEDDKIIIFIKNDIDFLRFSKPINKENSDIIILGNNKKLSNIFIYQDYDGVLNTGIFSKVRNLYVRNLNIVNAHVHGNEVNGIFAGDVSGKFNARNVNVYGFVDGHSICGGFVGSCDTIKTSFTTFKGEVTGNGIIGNVAGMANNADIDTSVVCAYSDTIKRENVGYLSSQMDGKINRMLRIATYDYKNEKN